MISQLTGLFDAEVSVEVSVHGDIPRERLLFSFPLFSSVQFFSFVPSCFGSPPSEFPVVRDEPKRSNAGFTLKMTMGQVGGHKKAGKLPFSLG